MSLSAIPHLADWILAITLAMARLLPCMLMIPLFGFGDLKGLLRYSVVITLALTIAPGIRAALPDDNQWFSFVLLYGKEGAIGLLLGAILSIPFWLFESVGALFDNQRGALMGGQLNPSLGPDFTPLGFLFKQSLIIIMIASGGFMNMLQVIWDSFLIWPPTKWLPIPSHDGFHIYLSMLSSAFNDMVLYALPLVGLLLTIEFGIAFLSVYSPQLQAYILSMPVKCLVGLTFLIFYIPTLNYLITQRNLGLINLKDTLKLIFQHIPHS